MYLIRTLWTVLLALLLLGPSTVLAQDCTLGVYANEEGSFFAASLENELGGPIYRLEVYYVARTEGFVLGVAWNREWLPYSGGEGFEIVASEAIWEPYSTFLETRDEGYRIGLGLCQSGYGGEAITVMKEVLLFSSSPFTPRKDSSAPTSSPYSIGRIRVAPNVLQDPDLPIVADCAGELSPCSIGQDLEVFTPVPVEGESFGRIKATYR